MKHLSTWFASILKRLGLKAEHPISENPKAENEREPANPETSGTAPIARTIEDVRDSVIQEYQRSQQEQRTENHKNRTIAKWAVLGAWMYAGIALFQWLTMQSQTSIFQNQLTEAQKEFEISERARIAIGRDDGVLADFYQFGDTCGIYVFFRNIGHTTAEHFTADGWWWDEHIGAVNFPAVNSDYVKQQGYGPDLPAQSPFTLDTIVPCDQVTLAMNRKSHMIVFGRYRFQPEGAKEAICEPFAVERMPNTEHFQALSLKDTPMCVDLPREHWNIGVTFTHKDLVQEQLPSAGLREQMERALRDMNLGPAASATPAK